ncbi:uncharacterized protein [Antedon mediterranea]
MGLQTKRSLVSSPVSNNKNDEIQFSVVMDLDPNASLVSFDSSTNVLILPEGVSTTKQLEIISRQLGESNIEAQMTSPSSDITGSIVDGEITPCSLTSSQDTDFDPNNLELDKNGEIFNFDLLPLIKEELKWKIQSQRLAKGKETLTVEEWKMREDKLTEEEMAKRNDRRMRNKLAAAKCRQKKRDRSALLSEKIDELDEQQKRLKTDLTSLRSEKEHLLSLLQDHIPTCTILNQDGTLVLCNTSK